MAVTPLPDPPARSDPSTFADKGDAFLGALPAFGTELNAVQVDVNAKQVTASNAATTASNAAISAAASKTAAEAASNAGAWVSGTTYTAGDVRYSPTNFRTFRRKTNGAGTTDPSLDSTNWVSLNSGSSVLIASADITAPIATIDFLNLFTPEFDSYTIEFVGLKGASSLGVQLQFAVAGTVDSGNNYGRVNNFLTETNTTLVSALFLTEISGVANCEVSGSASIQGTLAGNRPLFSSDYVVYSFNTAGTSQRRIYLGHHNNTSAKSGFRISTTAATNLTAGSIRIYAHIK